MPKKKKQKPAIDPRTPEEFRHFPKFIIGDDGIDRDRDFVIHCHYPRFIMEFDDNFVGNPTWIDIPIWDPALGEPAAQGAALMRQAGDFFAEEITQSNF